MPLFVRLAALCLLLVVLPPAARAQEAEPLQKSDVIRLLTGTTYTKAEVAGIIRQSCLSFVPTERDREDFRALGADDAVMGAIAGCQAPRQEGPVAAPTLGMERRIFDVVAGDTVRIPVSVRSAGAGVGGRRLQLIGSGALVSGSDARAETDASGAATFVVPVGPRAGTYNLTVEGQQTLAGSRAVTLRVRPAGAAEAVARPDPVALSPEGAAVPVRVQIRDRFGNAVADVPMEVRAGATDGAVVASGRSDAGGVLELSLTAAMIGGANRLVFVSGGSVLGQGGVARPGGGTAGIAVVAGAEQAADAGRSLPAPLVVRVTDSYGAPVSGVEVRFSAENGGSSADRVVTDAAGRASTTITMGASGEETIVTATAGEATVKVRFPITRRGMTSAEMATALLTAAELLEAGDVPGARERYRRVAEADPSNLSAATGIAATYAAEESYDEAIDRYRRVLRTEPSRREAQVGLARANLAVGDAAEAARWFDLALSQDRSDVASWVDLGRARARLGQVEEAREAFERALALDPGNEDARRGLDRLDRHPVLLEASVWGGYTDDNGRDPGFRFAEVGLYPGAGLEFRFAFDNAFLFRHPYLVRGRDDIEGFFGGIAYGYGPDLAHRTSFEIGRRKEPVDGTIQTTWTVDQTLGFASGGWLRAGGWLGHWFDRDDWVVFAETGIPAGSSLTVLPTASYGDYFGSGLGGLPAGVPNRAPAKELRVGLVTRYAGDSGFGVEPAVFYGNVDSEASEELGGSLWDASLRLRYVASRTFAVDGFVQYQSPPGLPSFWRVGLGLRFGVEPPG